MSLTFQVVSHPLHPLAPPGDRFPRPPPLGLLCPLWGGGPPSCSGFRTAPPVLSSPRYSPEYHTCRDKCHLPAGTANTSSKLTFSSLIAPKICLSCFSKAVGSSQEPGRQHGPSPFSPSSPLPRIPSTFTPPPAGYPLKHPPLIWPVDVGFVRASLLLTQVASWLVSWGFEPSLLKPPE